MRRNREEEGRPQGNEAAPDELGNDPREVGIESAGQSGDRSASQGGDRSAGRPGA